MGDSYGSTAYDYVVSEEEAISAVRTPPNCEVVPVAAEIPTPPSPLESYEGQGTLCVEMGEDDASHEERR